MGPAPGGSTSGWVGSREAFMTRVALLSSEPIRPLMAGIGIRYLELARRLPAHGIDVVLVSPAAPEETSALGGLGDVQLRRFERGRPAAIDLYDPWLIENFAYFATLGLDPYRNDHATWRLQMSRGDVFLCSPE